MAQATVGYTELKGYINQDKESIRYKASSVAHKQSNEGEETNPDKES